MIEQRLLREYLMVKQQISEAEKISARGRKRIKDLEEIFRANKHKVVKGKLDLVVEQKPPKFAWSSDKIAAVTSQKFHDDLKERVISMIEKEGKKNFYKVMDAKVANLVRSSRPTKKRGRKSNG